jgi:TPR repeat protein
MMLGQFCEMGVAEDGDLAAAARWYAKAAAQGDGDAQQALVRLQGQLLE